jgi:molybdenum cofactor sulfurtransferase
MCLIRPEIDGEILRLNFPDFPSIEIPIEAENSKQREAKMCETKVCGDRIQGWDCGDEVADWLCQVLSLSDLRLIKQSSDGRKNGRISLSNQAQFLLVSENSVKWLMDQVEDCDEDVGSAIDRFRANFVVEGLDPLAENELKSLRISEASFEVQGPCTRCQMICIDQKSGEKTTEPLRTIGKVFKGKMRFGIYLKHLNCSEIVVKCGDEILH